MTGKLGDVLREARPTIARSWAERVRLSSPLYRRAPLEELESSAGEFLDALLDAMTFGNYERIVEFMNDLAPARAQQGFEAADVQRALLMGCDVIFPVIERHFRDDARHLVWCVTQVERAIHRAVYLFNEAFQQARVREVESDREEVCGDRDALVRRFQALLAAYKLGAVAVDTQLAVIWADEQARSARCGVATLGERHVCHPLADGDECLLALALETGELQVREPVGDCVIFMAMPVRAEGGDIVEVLGIMGGTSIPCAACSVEED